MRQFINRDDWSLAVLYGPIVALLLILLFGIDVATIKGASMAPLLRDGQSVFFNRAAYGLQLPFTRSYLLLWDKPGKDDIVVVDSPVDGRLAIKRAVAVAGDSVSVRDTVVVTGGETYDVSLRTAIELQNLSVIPDNMVFVVGDNRDHSIDSRHYGLIPLSTVRGRLLAFGRTKRQRSSE